MLSPRDQCLTDLLHRIQHKILCPPVCNNRGNKGMLLAVFFLLEDMQNALLLRGASEVAHNVGGHCKDFVDCWQLKQILYKELEAMGVTRNEEGML